MKKNPAQEIIEAAQILIDNSMKKVTNINGGIITAINDNNKYTVYIKGVKHVLPSYPKSNTLAVGDTVLVITPQGQNNQAFIMPNSLDNLYYVKKSGDDMTGNLNIIEDKIDILSTSTTDIYGKGINFNDINNLPIGQIRPVSLSTGEDGIEIFVNKNINGTVYSNSVGLFIDKNGNQSVKISNPNAWKSALNIT